MPQFWGAVPLPDDFNPSSVGPATERDIDALNEEIAAAGIGVLVGGFPAEGLGPNIVEGVRRIKAMTGRHLIVWGGSTLTPVLIEHELADEILPLVFPVLLGTGKRFFSEGTPPREVALVSTKAASSGVIISTYKPNGPLRTSTMGE